MGDKQHPFNPGPQSASRTTPYKFSQEEMLVLQRCNKESFYQRSLPLSTIFGLGTYWCVKSGYLKPSPQWGASFKVAGAVIVGYFIGKLSYQQRCAEYFMALPNSEVGEALRQRRRNRCGGSVSSFQDSLPDLSLSGVPSPGDVYTNLPDDHRYVDLDTDRPFNEGLNDSFRPSLDYTALEEEAIPPSSPGITMSYDELRRRNREEYANKIKPPSRPQTQPSETPSSSSLYKKPEEPSSPQYSTDSNPRAGYTQKNVYGDVWER